MGSKGWTHLHTTIGTIFVDLGKLAFASLLLGSILRGGFDPFQTFVVGAFSAILLFVVGVVLLLRGKE
jgi:Ca2+/H+ antiporter